MILLFVFLIGCAQAKHRMEKKRNVLLIIVDDLRPLSVENVHLPNIHNLEANGITFENAFAQQALCAPSRNSMLTGRRPDTLRLYDFYSYWRKTVGNFTTLPQLFKKKGYETYSVGKVFHPGASSNFNDDAPYSWSHPPYHPPTDKYKNAAVCLDAKRQKKMRNLICPVNVNDQPGKSLPDLQTLEYAVKVLKRNSTKPFFLAVGFHKPHIPFKFPREYLERVPIETVKPPKHPNIPENLPTVAFEPWVDIRKRDDIARLFIDFPMGVMPQPWAVKIKQSYFATAAYIDDLIGVLIGHIDMRKTIVVLTSDHGWSLGENGLWAKYSNFDAALRVPLIFKIPGMPKRSIDTPVELLDLFPTLASLNGMARKIRKCRGPSDKSELCFEGKTLVPLMRSYRCSRENDTFAISQYPRPGIHPEIITDEPKLKDITIMGYSIRTKRYRYTEWIAFNNFTRDWNKKYGVELYDHKTDPNETFNLHSKPKHQSLEKYLSTLLRSKVDHQ